MAKEFLIKVAVSDPDIIAALSADHLQRKFDRAYPLALMGSVRVVWVVSPESMSPRSSETDG